VDDQCARLHFAGEHQCRDDEHLGSRDECPGNCVGKKHRDQRPHQQRDVLSVEEVILGGFPAKPTKGAKAAKVQAQNFQTGLTGLTGFKKFGENNPVNPVGKKGMNLPQRHREQKESVGEIVFFVFSASLCLCGEKQPKFIFHFGSGGNGPPSRSDLRRLRPLRGKFPSLPIGVPAKPPKGAKVAKVQSGNPFFAKNLCPISSPEQVCGRKKDVPHGAADVLREKKDVRGGTADVLREKKGVRGGTADVLRGKKGVRGGVADVLRGKKDVLRGVADVLRGVADVPNATKNVVFDAKLRFLSKMARNSAITPGSDGGEQVIEPPKA
jgi:hypothetical protein